MIILRPITLHLNCYVYKLIRKKEGGIFSDLEKPLLKPQKPIVHLALEFFSIILSTKNPLSHFWNYSFNHSPCCQLHRDICFCGKFCLVQFLPGKSMVRLY